MPTPRKLIILIAVVALAAGFAGGFGFYKYQFDRPSESGLKDLMNRTEGQPAAVDFSLFWDVWDKLNEDFVDAGNLDTQDLVYGAISGMVKSAGDPYTEFLVPDVSKKFQEQIAGSFSGVGMEIGRRNDMLTVVAPIKNTPAFRSGIKAGDRILEINDQPTDTMTVEEAVNLIRGRKGTRVRLLMQSDALAPRELELTRDTIKIPAVELTMLKDNTIAYLSLTQFSQNVDQEFADAAEEILRSGVDKLIVDVRNNPGGLLDSAVTIAGWFLDRDTVVVSEDFGDGTSNEFRASGNAALKPLKTVFLVNGGSASASEILAGAVHDVRKVTLIGETTYGKGSVQELNQFSDGSSLKVTIAKWLTPNGVSISDKGIEPDIEVVLKVAEGQESTYVLGEPGKDPQLDRAIEALQ